MLLQNQDAGTGSKVLPLKAGSRVYIMGDFTKANVEKVGYTADNLSFTAMAASQSWEIKPTLAEIKAIIAVAARLAPGEVIQISVPPHFLVAAPTSLAFKSIDCRYVQNLLHRENSRCPSGAKCFTGGGTAVADNRQGLWTGC